MDEEQPTTLLGYFLRGLTRANRARPFSFYLLLAMVAAGALGLRVVNATILDDPVGLARVLIVSFLFLFAILVGAVADLCELGKKHFNEHQQLYRKTFDRDEFLSGTGARGCGDRDR